MSETKQPELPLAQAWIRRLAQRIRHHQMKGYLMYSEDQLVATITDEYSRAQSPAQPSVSEQARKAAVEILEQFYFEGGNLKESEIAECAAIIARHVVSPSVSECVEETVDEVLYQMLGEFPNCMNGWATSTLPQRIVAALVESLQSKPAATPAPEGHHLPNWFWCERCQAWIETQHQCGNKST